jgi:chromosome segregation ATPase
MATDPKDYQIEILRGECERLKRERDERSGRLERLERAAELREIEWDAHRKALEEALVYQNGRLDELEAEQDEHEAVRKAAKEFLTNLEPFAYRFPNSAWNSGYDALVEALRDTEDEELAAREAEYDGDDGEDQDAG